MTQGLKNRWEKDAQAHLAVEVQKGHNWILLWKVLEQA